MNYNWYERPCDTHEPIFTDLYVIAYYFWQFVVVFCARYYLLDCFSLVRKPRSARNKRIPWPICRSLYAISILIRTAGMELKKTTRRICIISWFAYFALHSTQYDERICYPESHSLLTTGSSLTNVLDLMIGSQWVQRWMKLWWIGVKRSIQRFSRVITSYL